MKTTTKRTLKRTLSWKPHRYVWGDIYCSPACGYGCTREAFEQAQEGARLLVEELGPGFKPRVWENLGWHYEAVSLDKTMKVSPSIDRIKDEIVGYTAYFGEPGPGGRWAASDKTWRKAIRKVLEEAELEAASVRGLLESYRKTQRGRR